MKDKNKNWIQLSILLLVHLMTIVDIFIVNIAIPSIQKDMQSSDSMTQLVVAMYMIGFASFLIIGGKAGDYYGRKKTFILGLVFFMISSAGCGFAQTPGLLIFLRFTQGVSAGFMSPQVLSYIQILFNDHRERTYAMGWYGIAIGAGTMLGQFLGGFLVELKPVFVEQAWQYIFLINIPVCVVTIILARSYLSPSKNVGSSEMDYTSACMICLGLVMLIFSLTFGLEQNSSFIIISLSLSCAILLLFVFRQNIRKSQNKEPLLDPELFKNRNFNLAISAAALFMLMLDAYFYILALYLQRGLGLSPGHAGYFIVFQGAGFIFASLFSARLVLYFGKKILIGGLLMIMLTLIVQLVLFYFRTVNAAGYIVIALHGSGVALVLPSLATIALKGMPEKFTGNASGVYSTVQQLFGALGIACTGRIFYYFAENHYGDQSLHTGMVYSTGVHILCLTGVLIIMICVPTSVLPKRRALKRQPDE